LCSLGKFCVVQAKIHIFLFLCDITVWSTRGRKFLCQGGQKIMPVKWRTWEHFTKEPINPRASHVMTNNSEVVTAIKDLEDDSSRTEPNFGEAATLELSGNYFREKSATSSSMLLESKVASRTLKVGSRGDDVKRLQENLNTLGYNTGKPDGIFGNGTKNAVIAFQKAKGLTADGIVGSGTQNAITRALNEKNAAANSNILKVGSKGAKVAQLQNNLNSLGYNAGKPDGEFGNGTKNAVVSFQKTYGLSADGVAGKATQDAIAITISRKSKGILSKGQVSNDVKSLQNDLKTLGYLAGIADGAFGVGTESAVKAFQQKHNLSVDGLVGSNTRAQIAAAVNAKTQPKDNGVLKLGSKGNNVIILQNNLNSLGYNAGKADGQFGSGTQDAVIKFQKTYGLTADGQAGENTQEAIRKALHYKNNGVLSKGQVSDDVKTLQNNLKTLGYLSTNPDGAFGANTEAAVKAFQKNHGLSVDGLAGTDTRNKINSAVKNKTQPVPSSNNILKIGSTGEQVKKLQNDLKNIGYSITDTIGSFGESTSNAVKIFQSAMGLDVDGKVGTNTRNALSKSVAYANQGKIARGHSGTKVENLQNELKKAGFLTTAINKVFDSFTMTACAKGLNELEKQNNSPYAGATKAVNDMLADALKNVVIEEDYVQKKTNSGTLSEKGFELLSHIENDTIKNIQYNTDGTVKSVPVIKVKDDKITLPYGIAIDASEKAKYEEKYGISFEVGTQIDNKIALEIYNDKKGYYEKSVNNLLKRNNYNASQQEFDALFIATYLRPAITNEGTALDSLLKKQTISKDEWYNAVISELKKANNWESNKDGWMKRTKEEAELFADGDYNKDY